MIKEIAKGTEIEYFINKNNYFTNSVKKVYEHTVGINNIRKYYKKGTIPLNHFKTFLMKFFNDVLECFKWRCILINEMVNEYISNIIHNNKLSLKSVWYYVYYYPLYDGANYHLTFNDRNEFKKACDHVLHQRFKNIQGLENDYKEFWDNILLRYNFIIIICNKFTIFGSK